MNAELFDFDSKLWTEAMRAWHHDPYALDFRAGEPRKVKHCHGITVFENGRVEIAPYVMRDPRLREALKRRFGAEFRLKRDCPELEFFAPDGRPIKKKHLHASMVYLDSRHGMALGSSNYGYWKEPIVYYSADARPTCLQYTSASFRDADAEKALRERIDEQLRLGLSLASLSDTRSCSPASVCAYLEHVRDGGDPALRTDDVYCRLILISLGNMQRWKQLGQQLAEVCLKQEEIPYVNYKEKR